MQPITAEIHRVLDFVTVLAFALAPSIVGLTGLPATLAYVLAAVHLTLTMLTHFPGGRERPVPFAFHGLIEVVVGLILVALPLLLGWTGNARLFYIAAGIVILAVWFLTRYGNVATRNAL